MENEEINLNIVELPEAMDFCIQFVKEVIEVVEKNDLTNEQVFIDFLDKLNELSVKY